MKQSECPEGTVITLGHPANKCLAVKKADGDWRFVESGKIVDPEDFRGMWDIFVPKPEPLVVFGTVVESTILVGTGIETERDL